MMKQHIKLKFSTQAQIILTIMSQQANPDVELNQYSEDMTVYTLEQLVQWRASLERKAKEQEEKARAGGCGKVNRATKLTRLNMQPRHHKAIIQTRDLNMPQSTAGAFAAAHLPMSA
jgi:hypothetical protein